jgi:hypothetical protein
VFFFFLALCLVGLLSFGRFFGCSVFWPLFWLSFCLLAIVLNAKKKKGQPTKWQKDKDSKYKEQKTRTAKTMAKRQKDSQYNGQKTEGQPKQWPKDIRTANTMAKIKRPKGQ